MANQRRFQRGVVKQLSNLSIDEISLVDRGANQHALISIAKRAPQADDYFEEVEKDWDSWDKERQKGKAWRHATTYGERKAGLKADPNWVAGRKQTGHGAVEAVGSALGGGALAVHGLEHGNKAETALGAVGGIAGYAHGLHREVQGNRQAMTGLANVREQQLKDKAPIVHNHFYGGKRAPEETMDVDALFDVNKKKSSFGQGGAQAVLDEFSGDDPSGVVSDPNGEEGDIGPDGTIDGVETIEGEDTPPQKKKKVKTSTNINPEDKAGLGKSADFWKNVVSKLLDGDDDVDKHFPGPPGASGFGAQPPQPMMGGQMGAPPQAQSVGAAPMGMGQPMPPQGGMGQPMGGQAQGGMPAQLPPDVVQYIQQLEQALDQLTGGSDGGDGSDQSSSDASGSGSNDDDTKKNPFGKSLEHSMDEATFLTELSKALDDDDEREVVNKALETVSKAEARAQRAEEIAKAERDLRLEREFVAKAAEFNLPVKSSDLGPVLKRAAESLDVDDFQVIVKCLRSASAAADFSPYGEIGKRGGGANADILSEVDAQAMELVGKASDLTPEAATLQVLNTNPAAYDEYLRDRRTRQF